LKLICYRLASYLRKKIYKSISALRSEWIVDVRSCITLSPWSGFLSRRES
jgi:hypothetical protein